MVVEELTSVFDICFHWKRLRGEVTSDLIAKVKLFIVHKISSVFIIILVINIRRILHL